MRIAARILPLLLAALPIAAQSTASSLADSLNMLSFLKGTWEAKAELGNHILARHTSDTVCKGPASFDCEHKDLFYIYNDAPGQTLKAIYFDNEGHVIHYNVSIPDATTAIFLSDGSQPGPQFRLMYQLNGAVMSGKFQMRMPARTEWKSYLEWTGSKQRDE
jgi:hypothetical protein